MNWSRCWGGNDWWMVAFFEYEENRGENQDKSGK